MNPEVSILVIMLKIRLIKVHGASAVNDIMLVFNLALNPLLRVKVGIMLPTTVNMLATASNAASSRF